MTAANIGPLHMARIRLRSFYFHRSSVPIRTFRNLMNRSHQTRKKQKDGRLIVPPPKRLINIECSSGPWNFSMGGWKSLNTYEFVCTGGGTYAGEKGKKQTARRTFVNVLFVLVLHGFVSLHISVIIVIINRGLESEREC